MKITAYLRKTAAFLLCMILLVGLLPTAGAASEITVSVRLIGADKRGNYETWIATEEYSVSPLKAKVGTVLKLAADAHGLTLTGLATDYISAITAPEALGGYTMAEFTNGAYSGWMYTVDGQHPQVGINNYYLKDGDALIFHYVNDYRVEVEDWHGGTMGTASDWNGWLDAEDVSPEEEPAQTPEEEPEEPDEENPEEIPEEEPEETPEDTTVSDLIKAIDELRVTKANASTRKKLGNLEDLYDELSRSQRGEVTNANELEQLRDTFDELLDEAIEDAEDELEDYAEELDAEDEDALEELLDEALDDLSNAEDTNEIDDIVSDAKAQMDRLVGKEEQPPVSLSFLDVSQTDWFYSNVSFVVQQGLFNGTTATEFSPNTSMTRSMLVTVLYRLAGNPMPTAAAAFSDVPAAAWYSDAVTWAAANGIVTGYTDGSFGAQDNVTREQIAAILYRYAAYCGYDTAVSANLGLFADSAEIAAYALPAMQWANACGLIGGRTASTLAPGGTASRAEVAAIIHRFVEAY